MKREKGRGGQTMEEKWTERNRQTDKEREMESDI